VGNIYADEALHHAHIHPRRLSHSLSQQEISDLYAAIRRVLAAGIERQGATIGWYRQPDGTKGSMQDDFYVYDRKGEPCRTCGQGIIEKIVIGQRGTHYCPQCQK
jgi:formamidopyrimidine-DNA glycosylase